MSVSARNQKIIDALMADFSDKDGKIVITPEALAEKLGPKPKKTKIKAESDAPKRPKSAFMLWSTVRRNDVRTAMILASNDSSTKLRASDVSKHLGVMWKELDDESKAPYIAESKADKERYATEMKTYRLEKGIEAPVKNSKFDPTTKEETPDGWSGPFEGYLEKTPIDPETNKKITKGFHNFEEAVAEAVRLGAGGITKTRVGYRIRMSTCVSFNEASRSKGEISWTINK